MRAFSDLPVGEAASGLCKIIEAQFTGEKMTSKLTLKVARHTILAASVLGVVSLVSFAPGSHAHAQTPAAGKKNAGEVFKNVTTNSLKNLTVDDFLGAMGVINADLGLDCADCHPGAGSDKVDWVIDTPQKVTARKMIDMVAAINKTNFGGVQQVTCWTCHHGREQPSTSISLDKLYGTPNDEHTDFLPQAPGEPTGAQVLDKYIAALGGAQKLAGLKSWIATGTSVGYEGLGGGGSFQIFAQAPDKRATLIVYKDHPERGETHRTYDGKVAWNKSPRAAVTEFQLTGSELNGVRTDALLSFPGNIKTALTGLRTSTSDLGDTDVEIVQGSGPGGILVTLYFDKKTNLLVREIRYSLSPVGRIPTQTDYADYKEVDGIKFPFSYTFSWLDGREQYKITEMKVNPTIDPSVFAKPK
jgi:photosynthetic reaction center cytochrome c subunit